MNCLRCGAFSQEWDGLCNPCLVTFHGLNWREMRELRGDEPGDADPTAPNFKGYGEGT